MVRELERTMTQKGQVTIPAEIRSRLGLRPQGKVRFVIEDDQVRILAAEFTLESVAASVEPVAASPDFEAEIADALDEHAAQVARELRDQ